MPPHLPHSPLYSLTDEISFEHRLSRSPQSYENMKSEVEQTLTWSPPELDTDNCFVENSPLDQPKSTAIRRRRKCVRKPNGVDYAKRRCLRNQQERRRVKSLSDAVDSLQSTLWRETVDSQEERRPRLRVLQRSSAYIALLTSVLDGTASEQLSSEVAKIAGEDTGDQTMSRAQHLRKIFSQFEEEKEQTAP